MVTLRAGVRMMHRIAAAPPLSDYAGVDRHPVDLEDDAALDALIRNRADTVYHPVGPCRKGNDADAVVAPALTLNGIDGLSSEERREGKDGVSTCRSRCAACHKK